MYKNCIFKRNWLKIKEIWKKIVNKKPKPNINPIPVIFKAWTCMFNKNSFPFNSSICLLTSSLDVIQVFGCEILGTPVSSLVLFVNYCIIFSLVITVSNSIEKNCYFKDFNQYITHTEKLHIRLPLIIFVHISYVWFWTLC